VNAILRFGDEDPQVIFVVNNPMIVQSDHLPAKSKRKPDIIKVSLQTFKRWLKLSDGTDFNACRLIIANGKIKIFGKPYWTDVGQLKLGCVLADLVTKTKVPFLREASSTRKTFPDMFRPDS